MQIGNLNINNPVILAPMAGISDYPYRQIVREFGCQLLYTEMVSSKGLIYGSQRTEDLAEFNKEVNGAIAIQIFGENPDIMERAARRIAAEFKPDIIDINMGCPTPKIVKNGAGAALMKDLNLAAEIMSAVVKAVEIPVTIKMRKGWDVKQANAPELAMLGEECGIKAVAVHGRTRQEFYSGQADWQIIKEVKDSVNIPVIGNGDIFTPEDARKMVELTNCDGVMIGRGARGNPWLLSRTKDYLMTGNLLPEPSYQEKLEMALIHLKKAVDYFGEQYGLPRMRKHLAWYLKGLPFSNEVKEQIFKLKSYRVVVRELKDYLSRLPHIT